MTEDQIIALRPRRLLAHEEPLWPNPQNALAFVDALDRIVIVVHAVGIFDENGMRVINDAD